MNILKLLEENNRWKWIDKDVQNDGYLIEEEKSNSKKFPSFCTWSSRTAENAEMMDRIKRSVHHICTCSTRKTYIRMQKSWTIYCLSPSACPGEKMAKDSEGIRGPKSRISGNPVPCPTEIRVRKEINIIILTCAGKISHW